MGNTVRLKVTITWEYDADPKNYNSNDPKYMAGVDQQTPPSELLSFEEDNKNNTINFTIEPV